MAIVTLSDIHVAFGPEVVLDQLRLQLHSGEKVGMVGANGSGKSTILKLIVGQIVAIEWLREAYEPLIYREEDY